MSTFVSSYVVLAAGTNVSLTKIEDPAADRREYDLLPGDDIDLIEKEHDDDENVIPK